ncbi:MAG: TraB/GumN family protein [Bacteroidales bacterium]|nr:TraB/GumN family protein [Bacteroidales bacterium]
MKSYKVLITSLFLLFSIFIQAQENSTTEKSLLWEISGNGLETPSYIFGTIHLIPVEDYFFTDVMKEKLLSCKTLALEIDINMSLADKIDMAKKIMLPDGKRLSDFLTEEQYQEYSAYILDSLKIKESKFKQMNMLKPIFASSIILVELLGKTKTYEEELNKLAKKKELNVIGLETADYQLCILNGISLEKQIEMIFKDGLSGNPTEEFQEILDVYKEQDLEKMNELFKADESLAEFGDDLLVNRNKNWIPVMEKQMKKNSIFVAVGAAHLPGETGVLNLLRNKGYTITATDIKK